MRRHERARASQGAAVPGRLAPRCRPERGAALVETAIVIPVLLLIVFAVLELGMITRTATVASSASRAGARYAAANFAPATTDPARIGVGNQIAGAVTEVLRDRQSGDVPVSLLIYRATANGTPVGGSFASCTTDCLRYAWNGTTFTHQGGNWTPDACGQIIQSVGVYVSVFHASRNSFIPMNKTVDEHTVMRLEPKDQSLCAANDT